MPIRTLIVDDEPLARDRLLNLLRAEPDIEIVGQCANGQEAVSAIQKEQPNLVFLDVQMPELNGFDVLAALDLNRMPVVIFVTAFDRFALRAFEVHALDFLLKPFDQERFNKALDRARSHLKNRRADELSQRLAALLAGLPAGTSGSKPVERLAVKTEGRIVFVRTDDLDWIEAADNYVSLHVGGESFLLRETMNHLEGRLAAGKFLRISRSVIVNVERVKELQPLFHGEYAVILRNGMRLTLTRGYRDKLEILLGNKPG